MSFLVPVYALRLAVYHLFFIGVELGVVWTTCIDGVAYSLIVDVCGVVGSLLEKHYCNVYAMKTFVLMILLSGVRIQRISTSGA